jgi:hypothetical protein
LFSKRQRHLTKNEMSGLKKVELEEAKLYKNAREREK